MGDVAPALIACGAASCLYGAGAVLQSIGASRGGGGHGVRAMAGIARQLPYLAGLGCDLGAWLLAMYAVHHLPLFVVQTTVASNVAVTAVLAWVFLHAPLQRRDGVAIGGVLAGLVLVGAAAGPAPTDTGSLGTKVLLVAMVPTAVVLGLLAVRRGHVVIAGAVSGLLFSLGATTFRTLSLDSVGQVLRQPTAYALVAYFGAGIVVHARSLERGRVGPVTAAMWSAEILVATVAGTALFGDRPRDGAVLLAGAGMLLTLGATVVLALRPAPGAGRRPDDAEAPWTPAGHPR